MIDRERLKTIIHFICRECGSDPTRLGKVRLHKIIFLSDLWRFKIKAESISNAQYVKYPHGPFIREVDALLGELSKEGKLTIIPQDEYSEFDPVGLVGRGTPDTSGFEPRELDIIKENIERVCDHTAAEISEKTHGPIWKMAEMGEVMPLEAQICIALTNTTEEDVAYAASLEL